MNKKYWFDFGINNVIFDKRQKTDSAIHAEKNGLQLSFYAVLETTRYSII
jgi:hypothetical protein